jgi:hypothetical protein
MTTFETADDVFTAAQIEHGLAIANLLLHPSSKANDEVKVTGRALGLAARFAAKNFTPSVPPPAPLLERANNATWIETKTTNEKEI